MARKAATTAARDREEMAAVKVASLIATCASSRCCSRSSHSQRPSEGRDQATAITGRGEEKMAALMGCYKKKSCRKEEGELERQRRETTEAEKEQLLAASKGDLYPLCSSQTHPKHHKSSQHL
ncbi:hypothetical protein ACOSQ3_004824 [Xanthoceras sorbifolium]